MLHLKECIYIFDKLRLNLPAYLYYHSLAHTLDVFECATHIAKREELEAEQQKLLLVAVAYHDSGYMFQQKGHEEVSCEIAKDALQGFGYSSSDIDTICNIIMATQLPQKPRTLAEQIICDADLNYLGRDDFFTTGHKLYLEMLHYGIVSDEKEWDLLQVNFLKNHTFFTVTAIEEREQKKQENLQLLIQKTNTQ